MTRVPRSADDRGSLAMALMAVLVAGMLGALILPIVLAQNRSTRFDMTRVHALHAAQAGVDVAVGKIRASITPDSDGNIFGDPGKLPCYTEDKDTPLTGTSSGTGDGTYSVTVAYWATTPSAGGSPMLCSQGFGTYDPTTQTATPRYAVITSTGKDGAVDSGSRGRTLISTYVVQTDDTNIPGGQIRIFPDGSGKSWCMDAGAALPAAGTAVRLALCTTSTPPAASQVFAYRLDLSIQLVSSATKALPNGLCLDTNPTVHATYDSIVLKTCGVVNPAKCLNLSLCSPYNQQWSVDDNAHLRGSLSDKSNTDGYCINTSSQAGGVALNLVGCTGGTSDTKQTWVPSTTAGAGMAGTGNNQLVNYRQFANCLDVTGQDPNTPYLILYTCKQNPNPANVLWNQKFAPSPGLVAAPSKLRTLRTTVNGTTYCLTSPLSNGGTVRVTSGCPTSVTATSPYSWTMYQTQSDASGTDLPYAQKFTIVDGAGRCLGIGSSTDLYLSQYLKAVVSTCDGSTGQKWNANASLNASRIINTHEAPAP
jgi:Tfp pilus assembly protein PilX